MGKTFSKLFEDYASKKGQDLTEEDFELAERVKNKASKLKKREATLLFESLFGKIKKKVKKFEDCHNISAVVEIARPDWNWQPIKKRGLKPALTDMDSEIVQVIKVSHREIIGDNPILFFTDGYNEMDFLINDLGIPTVQYGPGDSSLCHTDEENIEINQLIKASLVYKTAIKNLCEDYNEN